MNRYNVASASNAIIIGFHVEISTEISDLAKKEEVDFSIYQIIYEAVNNVKLAMEGLLAPKLVEVLTGKAEVRQIFKTSKRCYIGLLCF